MRAPRIYVPDLDISRDTVRIDGQAAKHLLQVLRTKPGQQIILFDGSGTESLATVTAVERQTICANINSSHTQNRESNIRITLVQGISRGERMDWTLQKATELGVARIMPVFSQRSMVKLDGKRLLSRMQHWQGIIQHACEQCGRNILPELVTPVTFAESLQDQNNKSTNLYLEPEGGRRLKALSPADNIRLFVGPEGGFSPDEKTAMQTHNVLPLNLGPRILRTETAALAAITAMGVLWGDL